MAAAWGGLGGLDFPGLVLIKRQGMNMSSLSPACTFLFFPVDSAAVLTSNS